jgi:CubicO group peptidase (beta-lactamase class C family)
MRHKLIVSMTVLSASQALAAIPYDFSEVTTLAQRAVTGDSGGDPISGFDLRVLHRGTVVYHQSFGNWSLNRICPADSATKTVSGAVIMSLVDQSPNPFSLDTRLSTYIPAYSGSKTFITIRQCFSHTSGLASSDSVGDASVTLQEAALQIAAGAQSTFPGTVFSYGGTSMHAAGAVAELAGAESWNTLFAQRIAAPLGWTATTYALTSPSNPRIAGGCRSNATEFAALMEMLRRGGLHRTPQGDVRILSDASVGAMLTRQTAAGIPVINSPLDGSSDYGVGIWLDQRDEAGNLTGALAAGARGFSAWLDLDDQVAGAFATDRSQASNVQISLYQIRAAVERAVRQHDACVRADFNGDDTVDFFDYLDFVSAFSANAPEADFNADTVIDFFDYLDFVAVFGGC